MFNSNTHRVTVTQQTLPGTDYERMHDLAADAVAEARSFVAAFEAFANGACHATMRRFNEVKQAAERRNVLSNGFQDNASVILLHLARLTIADEEAAVHDAASRHLRNALNLSHRVSDLLAADRTLFRSR